MTSDRLETLEADIRKAMAAHAAIKPRGFDTIREREVIHAEIDAMYDEIKAVRAGTLAVIFHAPADTSRINAKVCACGQKRYGNFRGALVCAFCDYPSGSPWHNATGYDELDTAE